MAQIRDHARIDRAILFMGAARVAPAGTAAVTMTAADGAEFARAFPGVPIIPLHYEGWRHFSESRAQITAAFAEAGLEDRLHWIEPGGSVEI